jgi:hypothetical protein
MTFWAKGKLCSIIHCIESGGSFITKPTDIALNNIFTWQD